ncbi:hypothetical protein LAM21_23495, partial [Mycobacterium tuberculosis]|nr:hypothetical protein [Mycobacterium tuberculosis]
MIFDEIAPRGKLFQKSDPVGAVERRQKVVRGGRADDAVANRQGMQIAVSAQASMPRNPIFHAPQRLLERNLNTL